MKKLLLIILAITLAQSLKAQKIDARVYEPNNIKATNTFNTPGNLVVNVFIKDSRRSKLFSDEITRAIGKFIKTSYPDTKINFVKNLKDAYLPNPNKVLVVVDITKYFVAQKGSKWIGNTAYNVTVFDLRGNQIKKFKEKISHTATKPNKEALKSARRALNASFKGANIKTIVYVNKSVKGEGKFELVNQNKKNTQKSSQTKKVFTEQTTSDKPTVDIEKNKEFISDIDKNIPLNSVKYSNRYALIIGNEDYSSHQKGLDSESNVDFAGRDAKTFKQYAEKTLGIPDENIIYMINAQVVEFSRAIDKMNVIAKNLDGEAEIYFYYAGHGFPDEESNEPYLIPVDVSATDLEYAIKLNDIYSKLTEYPTKRVTVFLDACFSGGARNQGLIAARGVKVHPKENILTGNLVVFTASTGTQSSLSYKDQQHGLFTYYLLKKIQETRGEITYSELADYLNKQVAVKSVMINDKEQNPQVNISPEVKNYWKNWTFE